MTLATIDIVIIVMLFISILAVGIYASRTAGRNTEEFFLSGRNMPWWLLGISMVATTFSTDTPNLVTDIVRQNGVSGNWVWWVLLITGMLTVFVYARLWRKSNLGTDIGFYEIRYSGAAAGFLRGFRALFLGLFFNVLALSAVSLAAIKIGEITLGLSALETISLAGIVTVVFSSLGGLKGVIYTDLILFVIAIIGAIGTAVVAVNLPEVGGLSNLFAHPEVAEKFQIFPSVEDKSLIWKVLIIPFAVQWWAAWYPGAEPGGGGYVVQRMLAAKDENHAMGATFFFNVLHYALRPWPWILVALCSIVVFPDLASIQEAFPNVSPGKIGHDIAYPAMLTFLPTGLLGLVLASLIAAFMSTVSTHLNWGASYLVTDFYARFIKQDASQKELVRAGRFFTALIMVLAALLALVLNNALQIFNFILMFGAGTGLIFILRWFWWRINAWSEISAMLSSGGISILLNSTSFGDGIEDHWKFLIVVTATTVIWIVVTFLTPPEPTETLQEFYKKLTPGGPGWKDEHKVDAAEEGSWNVPKGILAMLIACIFIYSILFATGYWIHADFTLAIVFSAVGLGSGILLMIIWRRLKHSFT